MATISFEVPIEEGAPVWCIVGKGADKTIVESTVQYEVLDIKHHIVQGNVAKMKRYFVVRNGHIVSNMEIYFSRESAEAALQEQLVVAAFVETEPLFDWQLWDRAGCNIDDFRLKRNRILRTVLDCSYHIEWLSDADKTFWRKIYPHAWRARFGEWCATIQQALTDKKLPNELIDMVKALPATIEVLGAETRKAYEVCSWAS